MISDTAIREFLLTETPKYSVARASSYGRETIPKPDEALPGTEWDYDAKAQLSRQRHYQPVRLISLAGFNHNGDKGNDV